MPRSRRRSTPRCETVAAQELGDQDGSVVAIEPSTGRILAMVSSPSYDPNALATPTPVPRARRTPNW